MLDPKVHPPLATHFRLVGVDRDLFGIRLGSVMSVKNAPKEKWDISLKVRQNGKWRSRFVKVGQEVAGYKILDAEEKHEKVFDKDMNDTVRKDVSNITIQKGQEKPMNLVRQEVKYTGVVAKLVLEISPTKSKQLRPVRDGDILPVKDSVGQVEKYLIQIGDQDLKAVKLEKGQPGKEFPITRERKITIPSDVKNSSGMDEPYNGMPGRDMPGMGMPPGFMMNP